MKYDAIVIGAGMSGLAAGIRLAMFDKKVVILEKHSISGGLNSYYQRRNFDQGGVRQFDVGLHALTNFIKKGEKGRQAHLGVNKHQGCVGNTFHGTRGAHFARKLLHPPFGSAAHPCVCVCVRARARV